MSSFGCPTSMHYDPTAKQYVGKDSKTGQTKTFSSIPDYQQSLQNIEKAGHICPDVSLPPVVASRFVPPEPLKSDPPTGFLEFKPSIAEVVHAKYDPMSPDWQGNAATNAALKEGIYKADAVYFYKPEDAGRTTSSSGRQVQKRDQATRSVSAFSA